MTSILDSRYRVEEEIGRGGMGKVYRAFDTRLNIPVAIKVTTPQNSDVAIAFYREAELLSNLSHPALPRVTDFNKINENQYIVMEYIEGDDLKAEFEKRQAPFNPEDVLNLAKQLLNVLGYLHSQGVQHRDIKPANIKVRNNQVFLLDFSIAYGQIGEMSTMNSRSFYWRSGTFEFSSLEQINGAKTTPASDIYSLAATLYLLLSGKLPESPQTRIQTLALKKVDPLKNIRLLVPSLKKNVANAIMSALELDPGGRPQSAEQMSQMIFPQKKSKPKRTFIRRMAVAAGLITLVLFGVLVGANIQNLSKLAFPRKIEAAEKAGISPREEAISLTENSIILLQSAKYEDSMKKCEEALAKDPNYAYAHFVCGDAIWDTDYDDDDSNTQMPRVEEHADKILALEISPQTAEDFTSRAWANLVKGKYDIAIADATKALELKPDFVGALMVRASAKSFNPDENNTKILSAFDDFDRVVQLMPNYVQARANRASSYYQLYKYDWAISDYTEAIRVLPSARYFNGRGNCYYELGKYPEARTEYLEALKLNAKHLSSQLGLANTYWQEDDWSNAIKFYTKSIAIKPTFAAFQNRGYANGKLQQFDKAIKDFSEAIKLEETDSLSYLYRGMVFAEKENFRSALSDFTKAIEYAPQSDRTNLAELYQYRAAIYRQLQDDDKAAADEKKARTMGK